MTPLTRPARGSTTSGANATGRFPAPPGARALRTATLLVAALATLAGTAPVLAQGTVVTRATPAEAGMSAGVLAGGVALYEEAIARGDLVGAVLLVARDGKVVLHEALGWRDRARGIPMEPNTMFRMASNTKPVVATGVAMLVEDGKLAYDDPVREYMVSWDNYRAGFINIGHLLSHSSGLAIPTLFLQPYMAPSAEHPDAPTLRLEAARFGAVGAQDTPGTTYRYNNPGYNTLAARGQNPPGIRAAMHPRWALRSAWSRCKPYFTKCHVCYTCDPFVASLCVAPWTNSPAIRPSSRLASTAPHRSRCSGGFIHGLLGALIEIASETPLEEYLARELYAPLGMRDSYHHEVDEKMDGKLDRMSVVYYRRDDEGEWTPGWTPGDPPQVPFVRASGGMISTAADYVAFCQMFLNGGIYGGRRIISEETVELMTSPKIRTNPDSDGPPSYYGYGWSVSADGVFSHDGSDGTDAFVDPSRQLIVLVFTQTPGGRSPVRRFLDLVNLAIEG